MGNFLWTKRWPYKRARLYFYCTYFVENTSNVISSLSLSLWYIYFYSTWLLLRMSSYVTLLCCCSRLRTLHNGLYATFPRESLCHYYVLFVLPLCLQPTTQRRIQCCQMLSVATDLIKSFNDYILCCKNPASYILQMVKCIDWHSTLMVNQGVLFPKIFHPRRELVTGHLFTFRACYSMIVLHTTVWKFVLGCVISPLRQQAESRNQGQTFLANSMHSTQHIQMQDPLVH